ncbi:thiosulfate/3-mercaptopyruvate sulfurtransferase [Pseudooceanicola antarcticus]|uniref:Sulfurtransferase n=1 Tax=Pseudooceanicola antarcticus TaxID=1247613 RepID=A0A285JCE0_9RHOB|nr:rhodanese-like domain-containing protein [Pseudooceanicola antarcticus]PJE30935.1 sulfurtransferase [Pseudooceanicola antarcticus]SNY57950.1 thiosulfate/3-mercaptopyruvate sulfurtransferase [Pseudooceanicola antarcticus]
MPTPDAEVRRKVLLSPQELWDMLQGDVPPTVIAVQSINPYTGVDSRNGHWIPGAVDAEAYTDFAAPAAPDQGQRPLPRIDALQAAVQRWGIRKDRTVVLYDPERTMTAARAWWVLKWAGIPDVRVLDGGLDAWMKAGLETSQHADVNEKTDTEISPGHMPELTAETALALASDGVLLDARIRPNYIGGLPEGGDPKRGHIPGALSAPAPDNFTDEGPMTNGPTLAEMYRGLGATDGAQVGVYCGAGMSAAVTVLALASIGVEAAMYPGSWSQYIHDSDRPVKRGPFP